MSKVDLKVRAQSFVDDVVCQGVRYWFELSVFADGCHATSLIRSADPDGAVLGGIYPSFERMYNQAPAHLREQGVPPAVAAYVEESLRLMTVYR
jgi:hypothetical protein